MRISVAKVTSVMAVAAVAALGAQYAGAAPSHTARPAAAPLRNLAYVYSTTTTGGTGEVEFAIPTLPNGIYSASFSANFFPEGSTSAPETFSCSLIKDGTIMRAQSTISTTYDSGFYAGVNGVNVIKSASGDTFSVFCGTDDGTDWTWGTRPVQVMFTRLDGQVSGNLTESAHKAGSLSVVGTN